MTPCHKKNCQDSLSAPYRTVDAQNLFFFNTPAQDGSIDAANLIGAAVKFAKMIFPSAFVLLHLLHSTSAKDGRFPGPHVVMVLVYRESSM